MSWWRFYLCAGWVLGLELKELYKVVQKREEDDRQNVDKAVPDTSLVGTNIVPYLIFIIFFTLAIFLENKIYTEKARKLRQNTQ